MYIILYIKQEVRESMKYVYIIKFGHNNNNFLWEFLFSLLKAKSRIEILMQ